MPTTKEPMSPPSLTALKRFLQFLGYQEVEKGHAEEKKGQASASANQKSDLKLVQAIEDVVRSYIGGITKNELGDRFRKYSDRQIRAAIQTADIIPVLGKYYHRDQILNLRITLDTTPCLQHDESHQHGGNQGPD